MPFKSAASSRKSLSDTKLGVVSLFTTLNLNFAQRFASMFSNIGTEDCSCCINEKENDPTERSNTKCLF